MYHGWPMDGSIPLPKYTLIRSMFPDLLMGLIINSAIQRMDIRLGKAQIVTAIDDGGMSMYFRRNPSSQLSRRVVLSVEVLPPQSPVLSIPSPNSLLPLSLLSSIILTNPGETENA